MTRLPLLLLLLGLSVPASAATVVYDAGADFTLSSPSGASIDMGPDGVWTAGTDPGAPGSPALGATGGAYSVTTGGTNPYWSHQSGVHPFFGLATVAGPDVAPGDIYLHTPDQNSASPTPTGLWFLGWTAPANTISVSVTGAVWNANPAVPEPDGRPHQFELLSVSNWLQPGETSAVLNSAVVSRNVTNGSSPYTFSVGSTPFTPGDSLVVGLRQLGSFGDTYGLRFTVTAETLEVPEPAHFTLALLALVAVLVVRRPR